jgi:hypothetical protein
VPIRCSTLHPVLVLGQFARTRREPGENPGLPRSGKRERRPPHALTVRGREAVDIRKPVTRRKARKPEDLPASGAGEKSDDGLDLEASREAGRSVLAMIHR